MMVVRARYQPIQVIDGKIVCKKCGNKKCESEFYRTVRNRVQGECKDCARSRVMLHRRLNYEHVLASSRDRSKKDTSMQAKKRWTEKMRREQHYKEKAHYLVAYAIRAGKMQREPCWFCGSINAQAHHDDYSQPLNVMWLCQSHHAARHSYLKYFGHE